VKQPTSGIDLLAQYRESGAPEVFEQIMRAYGGMVFTVCLKVTKDAADAEDASQAVFLTLAVQCKTGATIHYLGPWLKKVAKRTSLDVVRSRKRRTRRETVTAEGRPDFYRVHPGNRAVAAETSSIIRAELEELPAKYRMPLVLHYFGGMSHEQISQEMKCTPAALGVRLHRARKMLGKRLTARGMSIEGAALGLGIATAVNHVVSDRFISTTTAAMVQMGLSGHAETTTNAVNLAIVPQIVQQVAQAMAQTRLRLATVILAVSAAMAGGAAEAMRHLPDSMRPTLEYFSPSRAIENLFRAVVPTPRMHLESPVRPSQLAALEALPSVPEIPSARYQVPVSVTLPTPRPAPIYALKMPTVPPPVSSQGPSLALEPVAAPMAAPSSTARPTPAALVTNDGPAPTKTFSVPTLSSASSGSYRSESAESDRRAAAETPAPARSTPAADKHQIAMFLPRNSSPSFNVIDRTNELPVISEMVDVESRSSLPLGPVYYAQAAGMALQSDLQITPAGTLVLQSNDIYVMSGNQSYVWSDTASGIQPGQTNSVEFNVEGLSSPGLMKIDRLPVQSTIVPQRPGGHTFIGIWSLDAQFDYERLNLRVHYDDVLAQSLGLDEAALKLWMYGENGWARIIDSSFSRDLLNNTLSGAIGHAEFIAVSAPEPAGVLGLIGTAAVTLLRRRRR
jgi:RNA polymerase sigma factor (sigma-70 family)